MNNLKGKETKELIQGSMEHMKKIATFTNINIHPSRKIKWEGSDDETYVIWVLYHLVSETGAAITCLMRDEKVDGKTAIIKLLPQMLKEPYLSDLSDLLSELNR